MSSVSLPMNIVQSAIVVPSLWNHPSTVNQSIHLVRPLPQRTNEHNTNYPSKSSSYCNSKKHVNQKLKLKSQSNILSGRATVFPHLQCFLHTYIHARLDSCHLWSFPKKTVSVVHPSYAAAMLQLKRENQACNQQCAQGLVTYVARDQYAGPHE